MPISKDLLSKVKFTKEQILKNIQSQDYHDELHIPPEIIPHGMEYAIASMWKMSRLHYLRSKGWEFVPASRHPELVFKKSKEHDHLGEDLIFFGKDSDLVLMERSIEMCEAERLEKDRANYAAILRADGVQLEDTPYAVHNSSRIQSGFGKGEGRKASFA